MLLNPRRLLQLLFLCVLMVGISPLAAQDDPITPPPTETVIPTLPPTETATELPSATPLPTDTPTLLPTLTETPLPTATETETPLPVPTASETAMATALPTGTETATPEASFSPSPSPTGTMTGTATETLTATATGTLPSIEELTLLFTDTFDAGDISHWVLEQGWGIVVSEGGQALLSLTDVPLMLNAEVGEGAIEARLLFAAGTVQILVGQEQSEHRAVQLSADGQVSLLVNGQVVANTSVTANQAGQWRSLRLTSANGSLRVAVDGVEVLAVSDAFSLPMGGLTISAVGMGGSPLFVDDLQLWERSDMQQSLAFSDLNSVESQAFTVENAEVITFIDDANNDELGSVYGSSAVSHPITQSGLSITKQNKPAWSPTLPLLAYACEGTDQNGALTVQGICIAKVDTASQQTAVTVIGGLGATNPRWSTDGSRLAWEESGYFNNGSGILILSSDIYQAGVTLQNGTIQITSPRTRWFDDECLRSTILFAVVNPVTMDWGADGYIYFGVNSGTGAVYKEGIYRFDGQSTPSGSCPTTNAVIRQSHIDSFNYAASSNLKFDARYPARVRQNSDILFSDGYRNTLLYRPAEPTATQFMKTADNCIAYDWSPRFVDFSCIREYVSGFIPSDLYIKEDALDTDSNNLEEVLGTFEPKLSGGTSWETLSLGLEGTPVPTATPTATIVFETNTPQPTIPAATATAQAAYTLQAVFPAPLSVSMPRLSDGNADSHVAVNLRPLCSRDMNQYQVSGGNYPVISPATGKVFIVDSDINDNAGLGNFSSLQLPFSSLPNQIQTLLVETYPDIATGRTEAANLGRTDYLLLGFGHLSQILAQQDIAVVNGSPQIGISGKTGLESSSIEHLDVTAFYIANSGAALLTFKSQGLSNPIQNYFGVFTQLSDQPYGIRQAIDPLVLWPFLPFGFTGSITACVY